MYFLKNKQISPKTAQTKLNQAFPINTSSKQHPIFSHFLFFFIKMNLPDTQLYYFRVPPIVSHSQQVL